MGHSEWYTPQVYIDAAWQVMGQIDIDVAAPDNRFSAGEKFYTKENSGLRNSWIGKIWCNPPYSDYPGQTNEWVHYGINQFKLFKTTSILYLVNTNVIYQSGGQYLLKNGLVCFVDHRIKYTNGESYLDDGIVFETKSPRHNNAFMFLSNDTIENIMFYKVFSKFGVVVTGNTKL